MYRSESAHAQVSNTLLMLEGGVVGYPLASERFCGEACNTVARSPRYGVFDYPLGL